MSLEFAKTPMGKKYYEITLPALIESQNRLAKATEEEHRKLLLEMKKMNINENDLEKNS